MPRLNTNKRPEHLISLKHGTTHTTPRAHGHGHGHGHVHLATLLASKIRLVVNSFKLHFNCIQNIKKCVIFLFLSGVGRQL